ncbi:hypothetical protein BRSU_2103 [Brachyspira suanatina]|uniref:DUF4421 domain-containing protein n=1 Tax=Brachyspira suanatina TaxID=381802 RepID=A0A0G4K9Q5_9SPIR|nr:hypothetical protein [Brachyspira suanatina]CRF34566.1 hypothetical protein BRSU_2103 [Brachyspira suanatina]
MKKLSYLIIFILFTFPIYAQNIENTNSLENKMNNYKEKVSVQWKYNPLRVYETDKYFSPWLDPDNYNTSFWFGDILNSKSLYLNKNFNLDNIVMYFSPKLAVDLAPIAFNIDGDKHRFRIGVAYSLKLFFGSYKKGQDQLYGATFLFGNYMQVEAYFEYIFNNELKVRFAPLRHICVHIGGDILGDNTLYDKNKEEFRDVGFEQMHLSANYRWGWFSFYGGTSFAISSFDISNLVNLFNIYAGTDVRIPLWGEISLITGIHIGAYLDRINLINRTSGLGQGYHVTDRYEEWTPSIATGIGFEIYRFVIGVKYEYARSKQLYAYRKMESRIGLDASLFF